MAAAAAAASSTGFGDWAEVEVGGESGGGGGEREGAAGLLKGPSAPEHLTMADGLKATLREGWGEILILMEGIVVATDIFLRSLYLSCVFLFLFWP